MAKYTISFGTDFSGKSQPDIIDTLYYYDNNGEKTVKDIKVFITCSNDKICTCMLKLYQIEKGWTGKSYKKYEQEDEDNKKLKDASKDSEIFIIQTQKDCTCKYLSNNEESIKLNKHSLIDEINKLKNEKVDLEKKNDELEKKNDELKKKNDELEKKNELDDTKQEDFYDIIIDINSIINVNKGWNVLMTKEGEEKYLKYKNQNFIKIGIVGNVNRGKTYILSKLSKIAFPSGVSINTKGLSIKYPHLAEGHENRKYILLDSAGLETPILNDDLEEKEYEEKEKEYEENNEDKKDENDEFKKKARDILVTESFLQTFIISNSDILILVIDKLSFSEQKLINKIKKELKDNKKKKKLYIIHNLKNYTKKSQVEKYIQNILAKSATFSVKKSENVTADQNKIVTGFHYNEENKDIKNNISVFHLLFAHCVH